MTNAPAQGFIIYHFKMIEYVGKSYFTRSAADPDRDPFEIGYIVAVYKKKFNIFVRK